MKLHPADRLLPLATGIFTELAEQKRLAREAGQSIIDLTVGSPDLSPPQIVTETLAHYAKDPLNYGYTLTALPSFLEAVAGFYERRYGVSLNPEREIVQLMGSQDGLAHLATALINPGDYVLVPDPGYPIYSASVQIAGGKIYPMALEQEHQFLPQLNEIPADVVRQTKFMILSYPGNPVTALAPREFFETAIAFAKQHEILIVHDFAYSELVFDGSRPVSLLTIPGAKEAAIEFNSFSKTFNMAGCRIGYAVGNEAALSALALLKSHIDYGVFYPIQKAAEAALSVDFSELTELALRYQERRDTLIQALGQVGWNVPKSPATMFIWAPLPPGWGSRSFAFQLLQQTGVAVTPGDAFGSKGEGYVRIALVQAPVQLAEAAERIGVFLRNRVATR